MAGLSRFCEHGNLRLKCPRCQTDVVEEAKERAAQNRARGEVGEIGKLEGITLHYPWQREAFESWQDGGRTGLVALSLGLPAGDLPYAVVADQVNASPSTNVVVACSPTERDDIAKTLSQRFGLHPSTLLDHHFLEPRSDGTLVVADLEELGTVDLEDWGRFASNGLLVLLDADGVTPALGEKLLGAPFRARFCMSRKPTAIDLLISRPWVKAFGPLLHRYTEDQARDIGVLPRIHYRLHVEVLKPEADSGEGPEGPWDPVDIPTRLPSMSAGPFALGRAKDAAARRAEEEQGLIVIHDGSPVKGARDTIALSAVPDTYDDPPWGFFLADPAADHRAILRLATVAWKSRQESGHVEDAVVVPVPADLCQVPPWDAKWRSAAGQLDRVVAGLLLAEDPGGAMAVEDLETLVGVALSLRGIPGEELHMLTPVVTRAAEAAHAGASVPPEEVLAASRAHGGLAAALLVAAELGPLHLLRIAHPRFTPGIPDLPHPSLYDARRHAWRGKAFAALAAAAQKGDLVKAWGRYPELRFVFPSSSLLEASTAYCARHKLKGPLDDVEIRSIPDKTSIATGDRDAAVGVLREWADALKLAEQHEREFLTDMHRRQPERERRREGMALPGLRVRDKSKDILVLEAAGARFPRTNISPGSEVTIVAQGKRDELGRGLVTKLSLRHITIECPDGTPGRLPDRVTANLTFDAKVFEAYSMAILGAGRALSASESQDDSPDGLVRAALLGETDPPKELAQSLALDNLTPSQQEAINSVLSGGRVRLVHGPPGTGKTHTLVHLAMALARAGHSVLCSADSNAAVDNLVVGLRRAGAPVVRIGHAPNLRDENAEPARIDPMDAPAFVRWAADQGIVVATTNYGAFRYIDAKGSMSPFIFDYVVHDEAGQSTAPSSLAAVMRGRRLVLAGDPLQLPPTVVSLDAKEAGLDVTLFERIEGLTGKERTKLLKTQFRMREKIAEFSNKRYYDGLIETAPVAAEREGIEDLPPAAFQHVTGLENPRQRNGSISNDYEADCLRHLVEKYRNEIRDRGWTMAVLTPYQAQREKLRRFLPDVEISTVDGAQGREWDVVFYSSVRSNPRHRLGFLSDERRLNVAVTRARRHFVLAGDERTLRSHPGFDAYLDGAQKVRMFYPEKDGKVGLPPKGGHRPKKKRKRRRGRKGGKGPGPDDGGQRGGNRGKGKKGGPRGRPESQRDDARGPEGEPEGKRDGRGGGRDDRGAQGDGEGGPAKGRRRRRHRGGPGGDGRGPDEGRRAGGRGPGGQGRPDGKRGDPKKPEKKGDEPERRSGKPRKAGGGSGGQCTATTKAGSRCKNRAKDGGRCARHSP